MDTHAAPNDPLPASGAGSPSPDHSLSASIRATPVDAHLVMNVLNQIAAKNFRNGGPEDPALFALSDYLQEVLRQQAGSVVTLADEVRLLETHLKLYAQVNGLQLDRKISISDKLAGRPAVRCLVPLATCLVAATGPEFGGSWRMYVDLSEDRESASGMRVSMRIQAQDEKSRSVDIQVAQSRLADMKTSGAPPLGNVGWSREHAAELRLECTVLSSG